MKTNCEKTEENDFYDDLPQHVKESINAVFKDIKEGKVYSHDEVIKSVKEKFGLI